MSAFFIVNPKAGKIRRLWRRFEAASFGQVLGTVRWTERRGHASELAREALRSGAKLVVAVGGDGTLSEAAHGLLSAGPLPDDFALAHFPAGSGCDFARHFRLPTRPEDWLKLLREGKLVRIDAGRARWSDEGRRHERYFVNIAMAGLAGDIVHTMERTGKPLGGTLSYLAVSLAHLCRSKPKPLRLALDGDAPRIINCHLLALANTATTGGGMRIAPGADAADGRLELITVADAGRARLLWNFPRIYAGTHLSVPGIASGRVRRLEADCAELVRLNLDGEAVGRLPASFEVLPGVLPILSPK